MYWQTCRDGSGGDSGRVEIVGRMEMLKYGSGGMYLVEKRNSRLTRFRLCA